MSNFITLRDAVRQKFEKMQSDNDNLYTANVSKDELWGTYLGSFPEGSNPIFRERTHHDCNCCKQFIRGVGKVVSIKNNKIDSIWNVKVDDPVYQTVADAMHKLLVKSSGVCDVFFHYEKNIGTDHTFDNEMVNHQWDHFQCTIDKKFVKAKESIPTSLGDYRANYSVLKRSLEEISEEAINTVLELIAQKSLYRGEENQKILKTLLKLKTAYDKLSKAAKNNFCWTNSVTLGGASKVRNTAIGTLLVDLSEGVDLEKAVSSYEKIVAPENYNRPKALITQGMIDKATKKVEELGIEDSLSRRFAKETDITINNVLFADRSTQQNMKGALGGLQPTKKKSPPNFDKVQEISIKEFVDNVLPKVDSIEAFVPNKAANKFVSLIAPENPDAPGIFKWGNNFSLSYIGELADSSIRTSVAERGGRVDGVFRFSHQWNYDGRNASLMDLHVFMPGSTKAITNSTNVSYGNDQRVGWNHRKHGKSGGVQDVDYIEPAPQGYIPVENITFPRLDLMPEGEYHCMVHNWSLRSPTEAGFKAEIEFDGQVFEYEVTRPLKHKEWVKVATVTLKNDVFSIEHHLPCGSQPKEVWGINTESFHKVKMVLNSPNHWDGEEVGNKHWMFILDGCKNPEEARGFYNEFLDNRLKPERKVFEVLASKMKTKVSDDQLSGLGFSSTRDDELLVKVEGSFNRMLKIKF